MVSELFYPEESSTAHILTRIAQDVSDRFEVLVLTGSQSYDSDANRLHSKNKNIGIKTHRAWVPNLNKNKLSSRIVRFVVLSISLSWQALIKSRREDIVFTVTNPAPLPVALALIRKIRKFTLVLLVHDVFPENLIATRIIRKNNIFYLLTRRLFNWSYRSTDAIVVIGRDMAEIISKKIKDTETSINIIENWADTTLINPLSRQDSKIKTWGLESNIVIQYAGNIGRAQGILEFVNAIALVNNNSISYVFCGSGALTKELAEKVKDRPNFILSGAYPRADQTLILGSCDIALVVLGPEMYGLGTPSKTYNIMAAGKPILFLGPKNSEVYRMIKENHIGWAFDWDEINEMIVLINSMSINQLNLFSEMGQRARLLTENRYSQSIQIEKFKALFESLAKSTDSKMGSGAL